MILKIILIILFGELWGTAGQVLFKRSVNSLEAPDLRSFKSYLAFARDILRMPAVWSGFGMIGIGVAIWLMALAQANLSLAFPIDSMQYIVALIFSRIFLGERIDNMKLLGTLLIIAGIVLVAMS